MLKTNSKKRKVFVFGTFDGIHDGHRYFLREAKKHGDELVVGVAKDGTVKKLKGAFPNIPLPYRMENLKSENIADKVIPGDEHIGKWEILKREQPDVVCLGYDQKQIHLELTKALPELGTKFEIVIVKDYKGDILHSSIFKT